MQGKQYQQIYVLSGTVLEDVPEKIKILPVGKVASEKGKFLVDEESYQMMKAEMERRGIDIVIDYEHQTLMDVQAPAAGWIKELEYTPEAIIAKVEWTPKAKEYLKNKEYRYSSPVVLCRKADGKAAVLHSLALTNTPAINGMFTIANSVDIETINHFIGGSKVDIKKLIEMLGLSEDATEEQVMQALTERLKKEDPKTDPKTETKTETPAEVKKEEQQLVANSVVLGLLGLPETAKTEDVVGSIMALKASPDVMKKMQDLSQRMEEKEVDDTVMMALKAGKITADQKDWAKAYALKDRKGFDSFVEKAPVVVPVGKIQYEENKKDKKLDVDPMILKATGMSKEDIEKYANKEELL